MRLKALTLTTLAFASTIAVGQATNDGSASDAATTFDAGTALLKTFDIPSQPLAQALRQFAEQTGLQLAVETSITSGRTSPEVKGRLSSAQALERLLAGSGLRYDFLDSRTVAVSPASKTTAARDPQSTRLRLAQGDARMLDGSAQSAQASGASGALGAAENRSSAQGPDATSGEGDIETVSVYGRGAQGETVRDVPQSTTVFNPVILDSIPATTVEDVIRFVPSASKLSGDYEFSNSYYVRGSRTTATWNSMIPGDAMPGRMELANVDRVEVLMGPSSILYGSMQPGAVINVITKQPQREFHSAVELRGGSFGTYGGSLDIGGPVNDRVRVRFNTSYSDEGSPFDHWSFKTLFLAPVVAFDLSDSTLVTLEGSYRKAKYPDGIYDGRIPPAGSLLPNPNGEIPIGVNPGYIPGVTHFTGTFYDANLRVKHQISSALTLNAQFSYLTNSDEGIDSFGGALNPDNRTTSRSLGPRDVSRRNLVAALNLAGEFQTGSVTHKTVVGIDYFDSRRWGLNGNHILASGGPIPALDLYDPVYGLDEPVVLVPTFRPLVLIKTKAAFIQERASIGEHLALIAGLRYTDSRGDTTRTIVSTGAVTQFPDTDAKEWSTQFGALYTVSDALTLYANRSTSFFPRPAIVLRDGSFFGDAETAKQYEVGARVSIPGTSLSANLAAFRITKPNILTTDPIDPRFQVAGGAIESKGIELSASGQLMPGWTALLSYAYNPTEITKSNRLGEEGLEFQNSPKTTVSAISHYEVQSGSMQGLGFSVAVNHLSSKFADTTNLLTLPSSTRVDLGLNYRVNNGIELELQGRNITDETIYNGFFTTLITRNAGRTYMFNVKLWPGKMN